MAGFYAETNEMKVSIPLTSLASSSVLIKNVIKFAKSAIDGNTQASKNALSEISEITATSKLKPEEIVTFTKNMIKGNNRELVAFRAEYGIGDSELREIERVLNSLAPAFIRTTNKALEREKKKDLSLASNEVKEKLTQSLAQVSEKYKIPEAEILRNVISMLS